MTEPKLVQQQRNLLRTFQQAVARRVRAEASADARFKSERETQVQLKKEGETDANAQLKSAQDAAEAALAQTQREPNAQLGEIHQTLKAAQDFLNEQDWNKIAGKVQVTPATGYQGADSPQGMGKCSSSASQALVSLRNASSDKTVIRGISTWGYRGLLLLFLPICALVAIPLAAISLHFVVWQLIAGQQFGSLDSIDWVFGFSVLVVVYLVGSKVEPLLIRNNRIRLAKSHYTTLAQAVADAEFWHQQWLEQARDVHQRQLAESKARHQQALEETNHNHQQAIQRIELDYRQVVGQIRQAYQQKVAGIRPALASLTQQTSHLVPPWSDMSWSRWEPMSTTLSLTRLGELETGFDQDHFRLPAAVAFPGGRSLLLSASGKEKARAVQAIQSLLLRLLATIPPGKLHFTFIDPVGLGQNVAPFMHLKDFDEKLVTGKAWTEPQHIEQQLANLTEQMENVIQAFLRNQYQTIEDYNASPGEGIYNDFDGMVEGNNRFQVAWLPDEKLEHYLEQVSALAKERNYRPPHPQIVFEGNAPAEVEKNHPLHDLLSAPNWPTPSRRVSAWLGEPIAIKPPTAAHFRRQSGSNLLMVGQNGEAALGVLSTALASLAAQHSPSPSQGKGRDGSSPSPWQGEGRGGGRARFYLLDFGSVDSPHADLWPQLVNLIPHPIQRGRRRQLPAIIAEIAAEVDQRLEKDDAALWNRPSIYLVIYGLQRARDLRPDEDAFGAPYIPPGEEPPPPTPAQQFPTILREGPDLGVHTLLWCDTYTNLNRVLDRRVLREFEMRVAFQMNAEDSANLVDTPAAGKLGPYRALFYSEDEDRLEKFRPYSLPPAAWLQWVGEHLAKKT